MSTIGNLIKGSSWLGLSSVISKVSGALVIPVLAKTLGPEALGIYSVVFSLAQSGQGISVLGADVAIHRNGAQLKKIGADNVGRLFGVGATLICLTSLLIGFSIWLFRAQLAERWLGQPHTEAWIGVAALLILLQSIGSIPLTFLVSLQDFRSCAILLSIGTVINSVLTVLLAWSWGLKGAIAGMLLSAAAQVLWSIHILKPVLDTNAIRLQLNCFWQEARSILKLGLPYYFGNNLLGILAVLPVMGLVSQYGGLNQLGYLRVAQSMAAIISLIPNAIAPAATSFLSAGLVDGKEIYQRLKFVHLRSIWILLLILTYPSCLFLQRVINLMFGTDYLQVYTLAWISLWMALLNGILAILVQYLLVTGKTVRVAWVGTLGVICFITTSFILVPYYHAKGFLIAQLIGQLISLPFVAAPAIAELNKKELSLLKNLLIATIFSLTWTMLYPSFSSNPPLLILSLLFIAILPIYLFAKVLNPSERSGLKKLASLSA